MHPEVLDSNQKRIFKKLKFFPEFYLAGGTALALQISHRKSQDFDFFPVKKEVPENTFQKVKQIFFGFNLEPIRNHSEQMDFLIEGVKVTFVRYPFPPFRLINYQGINILPIKEIAASKAYTIGQRATFKDYFDLYWLIKYRYVTINEIIKIAQKKYKNEFNDRLFLEQLIYLEDVEEVKIVALKKDNPSKSKIQKFFEKKVREIKI